MTVAVARRQPEWALAGSPGALAIEVSAGIALALAAIVIRARGPDPRSAALLYGASIAWLVAEWNNPGAPGALIFTLGMVFDVHGSRTRSATLFSFTGPAAPAPWRDGSGSRPATWA